jgi:class 3 adenylate cyclase
VSGPLEPEPTSERRQLTVVFVDLVNSTSLATTLDPEDFHEVIDAYQHQVAEVIASHGGTVTQFQGDGVVSYFGWPMGSDSASQDALSAGLGIVEAVGQVTNRLAVPGLPALAARVGIHTGVVVVAPASAGGVLRPADIFGDAPTVASRLQGIAGPGQVVVSGITASLNAGWFVMEPLGARALKGFEFPMEVFGVIAPTGIRSRLDAGHLTKFVGRKAELAALASHWEATRLGRPRAVMVVGEPGIGKSRLVREFVTASDDERRNFLTVTCFSRDALSPLQPFASLMDSMPKSPAEAAAWVVERIRGRPFVLLVEDAHWADPSTVEALERLSAVSTPLLLLMTARPEVGDLAHLRPHMVALAALDSEDAVAVVESLSMEFPIPAGLRDQLVRRGAGVPLFLEELTRSVNEESDAGAPARTSVPYTLGDLVTARLDRLGEAKRTAQLAAVIGAEFDLPTLQAVAGLSELEGSLYLAELEGRGILHSLAREGTYQFQHALMQEAAYESLLRRDRRHAHGRVADALAAAPAHAQARPEVLAAHLGLAGRPAESVPPWEQAARRAARRGLFKESAAHLAQALIRVAELPDGPERDAVEMRVRLHLGQYQAAIDQASPTVGDNLRRSLELAVRRGDGLAQVEGYLSLAPHYQAVTDYPAVFRTLDTAREAALEHGADSFIPAIGMTRGAVLVWQGQLGEGQSAIIEALDSVGITMDGPPSLDAMSMPGLLVDVVVGGYLLYALAECLSGRAASGYLVGEWASDLASTKGSAHAQCMGWTTRAVVAQIEGDVDAVRSFAAQALALADDRTTAQFRSWAAVLLAWADGRVPELPGQEDHPALFMRPYLLSLEADRTADPAVAVDLLDEALTIARANGECFCEAELLRLRSRRQAEIGDLAAWRRSIDEAIAVARSQGAAALEARAVAERAVVERAAPDRLTIVSEGPGDSAGEP